MATGKEKVQHHPNDNLKLRDDQCLNPQTVYQRGQNVNPKQPPGSPDCIQKALFCHLPENFNQSWYFPCLFGTILNNTTDIIHVKDRNFKYLMINEAGASQFGKLPQEMIGKDAASLFPPDTAQKIEEDDRTVVETGTTLSFEHNVVNSHGELKTFLATKGPIFNHRGYVIGLFTVAKDITAQKESEERLKLALEAGKMGISDWIIGRRKMFWNGEQKRLFSLTEEPGTITVGKAFSLIYPDDRPAYKKQFSRAKSTGEAFHAEFRIKKPDGTVRWVEQFSKFVGVDEGQAIRMVSVNLDITKEKEAELAVLQAKKEAEDTNQLKSRLLAHISHEIRSPITVVQGMLDLALNTPLSPEQDHCLKQAREAAELLSYVIDDILDFSTIEAKKLHLQSQPFILKARIKQVIDMLQHKAKEKGLDLDFEIAKGLPQGVTGDEYRLQQVLLNLIGNAIKYTNQGHVKLSVDFESRDETSSDHRLRFSVEDTGIGIDEETKESLFQPFSRGKETFNRTCKGTGLGLLICKEIVALLNGEIWFESKIGKGSVFTFTAQFGKTHLPGQITSMASEKIVPTPKLPHAKLLVVEDNAMLRNFLNLVLCGQGYQVTLAKNGFEALKKHESDIFDLVIMDVQMPEMDGLETTRLVRNREREVRRHTPIIALTAHAMKEHESRCLEAGMDDFISKPIQIPRFLSKLNEHLK